MRIRTTLLITALVAALPMLASTTLFTGYESVRQSLLKGSLQDVQAGARQLAAEATKAKQADIAKQAAEVSKSTDLTKARASFATLSEEMIKVRSNTSGDRPAVYYCSMVKKSWLQPKGQVGNPYDPSMPRCGTLKEE
jgi:hypothetical protein